MHESLLAAILAIYGKILDRKGLEFQILKKHSVAKTAQDQIGQSLVLAHRENKKGNAISLTLEADVRATETENVTGNIINLTLEVVVPTTDAIADASAADAKPDADADADRAADDDADEDDVDIG